jgi:hypothetical protein
MGIWSLPRAGVLLCGIRRGRATHQILYIVPAESQIHKRSHMSRKIMGRRHEFGRSSLPMTSARNNLTLANIVFIFQTAIWYTKCPSNAANEITMYTSYYF